MKRPVERAARRIALVEWGGDAWLLPAGSRAANRGRGSVAFSDATEGSFEAGMEMRSGVRGRTRTSELIGSETDAALGRASEKNAEDLGQCDGERRRERLVDDGVDEKIIGHRMRVGGGAGVGGLAIFLFLAFAILHEPAGEHGAGVFVEPLVEQGADLLAEIGGVAEASEFIRLQGIARSG